MRTWIIVHFLIMPNMKADKKRRSCCFCLIQKLSLFHQWEIEDMLRIPIINSTTILYCPFLRFCVQLSAIVKQALFNCHLAMTIKILFLDLEFDLCSADPHWCDDPGSLQVLFASPEIRHPAHTFTYNGSLLYAILSDGKELGVFLGVCNSQETIPRMTSHSGLLVSRH